jgi:hypothetical protein
MHDKHSPVRTTVPVRATDQYLRAFLSLLCSLVSLGVEIFLLDLQSMRSGSSPGSSASNDPTRIPGPNSGPPNPMAVPLSIFQLAMFTLAIGWSSIYIVLIHIDIRGCRCKSETSMTELEMGMNMEI